MAKKLFLRLDRASLSGADMAAFSGGAGITPVDAQEHCYQFRLDDVALDHALLLLGANKSRFGFDLSHYLHSVDLFLDRSPDGFLVMPGDSTPDFKRRFAEDLAVAIGSLFLRGTVGLKWETVAQIPTNKKLDKRAKTPDFVGLDASGTKRVYECKGTTLSDRVDGCRQDAKAQLADHQETGVSKLALVSYVPTSAKLVPPFLFASDPPIALPRLDSALTTGLHCALMLEFAGFDGEAGLLRRALAQRHAIDDMIARDDPPGGQRLGELFDLNRSFLTAAQRLTQSQTLFEFSGERFVGRWLNAPNGTAFTGVSSSRVVQVAEALQESQNMRRKFEIPQGGEDIRSEGDQELASVFSDGSLLVVRNPR